MSEGIDSLDLVRIIGFSGSVRGGLQVHTDNKNLIYPLGCNVIIEDIGTNEQIILSEHTNNVTCITIDPTGKYIATGQMTFMGFLACIVVWDYETKKKLFKVELHKVKVEALVFSADSKYLVSLGGRDDGVIVVWHLGKQEALCGSPAQVSSAGITHCLAGSKVDGTIYATAGNNTLRIWKLDAPNRKIWPTNVQLSGGLKREIISVEMVDDKSDKMPYLFCGTTTGDILVVNIKNNLLQYVLPAKDKFSLGVTALTFVKFHDGDTFDFLVGTGDGLVGRYEIKATVEKNKISAIFRQTPGTQSWMDKTLKKRSAITSIAKRGAGHMLFVGTEGSQIYKFMYSEMKGELIKTCHSKPVNDVLFPFGTTELIVTCQHEEIRIWNILTGKELRRLSVSNMNCYAICITRDGKTIFSAWDDGKVRVYGFKPGTNEFVEKFMIRDCHNKGVTAIAITACGRKLVTGGGEGQVRVWEIVEDPVPSNSHGVLLENMKEHKGAVNAIQIHPLDTECVSASTDGSTIIWDLKTCTRKQIVLANTLFKCVCYGYKGVHILTGGSDRKIGYWEVSDGTQLREIEGSGGGINAMDIASNGKIFITGGEQKLLKVWKYNEGVATHVGIGHSSEITKARICPNLRLIVSAGSDGAILIWRYPKFEDSDD